MLDSKNFHLFETMLLKDSKIFLLKNHIARIYKSAKHLGFSTINLEYFIETNSIRFNDSLSCYAIRSSSLTDINLLSLDSLWDSVSILPELSINHNPNVSIIKLMLFYDGAIKCESFPYMPIKTNEVAISEHKVLSNNPYLFHKTSNRTYYAYANLLITQNLIFDALCFNEKGELTEGTRSNIILRFKEKYVTPKKECGLLSGTLLNALLYSEICTEAILYCDDIKKADEILCLNSVRGIIPVKISFTIDRWGRLCGL